jgi:micrococcal nuclease
VDKQATIEQALAATITLIPTFTMAPTKTATASPSLTPTDTATKIPTVTPITAEPMAGAVNQAAVLGGPSACIPPQTPERGIVSKVIDGDTIDVVIGNKTFPVRYIGMDTLEMSTGGPMAMKAKVQNEALVYGKTVALYRDRSETDRYDRLLRYVMVGDLFINYDLIKTGYAEAKSYSPDTTCDPYFKVAEQEAQLAGLGLWAAAPEPSLTPMVVVNPPSKGGGGNCDPSYPTVCILPPPPDLDCGQIDYSNFKVLPPDPHNFDGDHDGVGCEG